MRITLLHYTSPPVVGGVERIVAEHAQLLAEHGHDVTILCGEGEPAPPAFGVGRGTVRVQVLPALRRSSAPAEETLEPNLSHFLAEQDVCALHNVLTMPFHPALQRALWRCIVALPRVRFLAWVHDVASTNPDLADYRPALSAHPRAEYVAVSELRRQQFCTATGSQRCRVIPNGFDPLEHLCLSPTLRAMAQAWRLLERTVVLLQPARLLRRKNVETSLAVLAALREMRVDAVLLVTAPADPHHAPSQEYAAELRQRRAALDLVDRACFVADHFAPTPAEVDGLYALSDALLLPSRQEGFGLPLLEAALHRLPIFCSDVEPLPSLLSPGAVTAFPLETSPEAIAVEIMRQVEGSQAIKNRKAAVRSYGWSAIYHKYLAPLLAGTKTLPAHETYHRHSADD